MGRKPLGETVPQLSNCWNILIQPPANTRVMDWEAISNEHFRFHSILDRRGSMRVDR